MRLIVCLILLLFSQLAFTQPCPAGKYRTASGCSDCPPGNYCPGGDPALSIPCPAGTYQNAAGASTCINCVAGTYNSNLGSNSSTFCTRCPAGKYSTTIAATSSSTCINCPAGTYSTISGASSPVFCTNCPAGTYSTTAGAANPSFCLNCPAGTFSVTPGANSAATCINCDVGTYQNIPGSVFCLDCTAGTYQSLSGQTNCIDCAAGNYQPNSAATSCIECGAGSFQPNTGASDCISCGAGTYQPSTASIACINCPGGSTSLPGSTDILDCNIITPVKLVSFNAVIFEKGVWLTWETAQEINSKHFAIERSANGREYRVIGYLNAAGTFFGSTNYYFTDSIPLSGVNYYRLKQVDLDGKFWNSPARMVQYISNSGVAIFPNPSSSHITLQHPTANISSIKLMNGMGQTAYSILINNRSKTIDISTLKPGIYLLEIVINGNRFIEKVIKQ